MEKGHNTTGRIILGDQGKQRKGSQFMPGKEGSEKSETFLKTRNPNGGENVREKKVDWEGGGRVRLRTF